MKIPFIKTLVAFCNVFFVFCFVSFGQSVEIWVSTTGLDTNSGTKDKPLASLNMALRKVRELRRVSDASIVQGVHIYLKNGFYPLTETVFIRPEDSGNADSPTIISSAPNEQAILSGGVAIKSWRKLTEKLIGLPKEAVGKVWIADVPNWDGRPLEFRQLWVNSRKGVRAKDTPKSAMNRILSWNRKEEYCWIPTPKFDGIAKESEVEMFIHQWWEIANLRIKNIDIQGDSTKLTFHQPESRIQSEHPWPAPWISKETGNSAYYLTNAIQFLNEAGEWFLDRKANKIYYLPLPHENMQEATAIAPALETLLKIEGTIDHPVSYIFFQNLAFQHSTWLRPSTHGHVPHQAGMYMLDAYKLKIAGTPDKKTLENQAWVGRPAAAVQSSFSNHVNVENCSFEHLASTGLDFHKGVFDNKIKGNLFKDIGGTGIQVGVFSDESTEIHLPYNPSDSREITNNVVISNNLITDVSNEDWGCVGIGAGFVSGINIEHNEINNVSYSGISMGWGWTRTVNAMKNNRIFANKIHHYGKHNYDCAGIYTLSAQPNTIIAENYIDSIYKAPFAHIPNHWFYLYTDEGSSYMTIKDNWTPSEKYLQNANGPGNTWENNGSLVVDSIKQKAGLQKPFRQLLQSNVSADKNWLINKEKPVVIELIVDAKQPFDLQTLKAIMAKSKVKKEALFQWENHYVIFDKVQDLFLLRERLKTAFPLVKIKTYDDYFYEFNRENCGEKPSTKEQTHIVLTANLVADTTLQREYLTYHANQFKDWAEVSKGFCKADFQQLLIYKNGRQLMLIISIPKGESLDKLNPKTTENNPRVNDWNTLMQKYQEGIEGKKKGETWVFLKEI
ncbi:right-handed parallel beta-helix repeat-containing protein [Arcicella sp. LKC2W]|uniref:right-handed parallel beta-helix repeat-containing protein n=1 Tax=Arcicella sp. LKC2W TaxID=2984198 RepID=UPI002B21EB1B|nr:right-handed parallel beta-helix repeat-containing protein [Arcicella sp. LKC2W]MEA5460394.1 right-handed parallel beta-helix repeat-containing protein [Arcicella sp. LKC2W]